MVEIDIYLYIIDRMNNYDLSIRHSHEAFCHPDWIWDSRTTISSGYNLWYIKKGKGRLQTENRMYELKPGDCFLLKMDSLMKASHDRKNTLVVPFVVFDILDDKWSSSSEKEATVPDEYRNIGDRSFFENILDRIIYSEDREEAHLWLKTALVEMEKQNTRSGVSSGISKEQFVRIQQAGTEIKHHPEAKYEVRDLASEACYSTDHFIRLFRQIYNTTPGQFIIHHKMKKACELLKFSNFSVERIADLLSYRDIFSFSKQFKKETGLSPLQYRKQ